MESISSIATEKKGLVALFALFVAAMLFPRQVAAMTCEVSPSKVPINLSYHGATLTVQGESGPDDDLVIRISAAPADVVMKYKGKVAGLFWMKKGNLEFKELPPVYLVETTAELERILSAQERERARLGYEALSVTARVEDDKGNPVDRYWVKEFIRFKEKEDLYAIREGTVTRRHGVDSNHYQVEVAWPYQAPPGTYQVEALAVRDGKIVDRAATEFEVARVGLVAKLSKMAFEQPSLYGIMAIIIAMVAGFAVGAIFKGGGGH